MSEQVEVTFKGRLHHACLWNSGGNGLGTSSSPRASDLCLAKLNNYPSPLSRLPSSDTRFQPEKTQKGKQLIHFKGFTFHPSG